MKDKLKRILERNPLAISRHRKLKKRLKNHNFTILCHSCIGGELYHVLGEKFCSPTINLMMSQKDFIKFVLNFDIYSKEELVFFNNKEYPKIPCARLKDITIHFTHYESEYEAKTKWIERMKRVDLNNLFIICNSMDCLSEEEILSLKNVKAKGILIFSSTGYEKAKYVLKIPKYKLFDGTYVKIQKKNYVLGKYKFEKYFDFVSWINEANGMPYDISKFSLIN